MTDLTVYAGERYLTKRGQRDLARQLAQMTWSADLIEAAMSEAGETHRHAMRRVAQTLRIAERRRGLRSFQGVSEDEFQQLTQEYLEKVLTLVAEADVLILSEIAQSLDLASGQASLEAGQFLMLDEI